MCCLSTWKRVMTESNFTVEATMFYAVFYYVLRSLEKALSYRFRNKLFQKNNTCTSTHLYAVTVRKYDNYYFRILLSLRLYSGSL